MIRFQQKGHALGSDVVLTLIVKKENEAEVVFRLLWSKINQFEKRFSRFLPDSELTMVNQASGKQVSVSKQFIDLAKVSLKLSKQTKGLYNPFVLPALQDAGYVGSWPNVNNVTVGLDYSNRDLFTSATSLKVNANSVKIPANSALDFGGIGKGYLLDQLAEFLDDRKINNYWLSLGGDIICSGYNLEEQPWQIGVSKADNPEELVSHIKNGIGYHLAIATSGVTKRKGHNWHHIIDPRTGKSASTNILTATVSSHSATEADVLAKCLVIAGPSLASKITKDFKLLKVILQAEKSNNVELSVV